MSEPIVEYIDEFNIMDFASKYAERISRVIDEQTLANVKHQLAMYGYVKVVRCRDCKFCDNDVFAYWCCREKYREFEVDSLDGERMGFCAWGERRDI